MPGETGHGLQWACRDCGAQFPTPRVSALGTLDEMRMGQCCPECHGDRVFERRLDQSQGPNRYVAMVVMRSLASHPEVFTGIEQAQLLTLAAVLLWNAGIGGKP